MKCKTIMSMLLVMALLQSPSLAEDTFLSIHGKGGAGDFENNSLKISHPHIQWTGIEGTANDSAQNLAFQMQTNHQCFDLYAMGYAYSGFELLRDKGFALDLASYPAITSIVDRMYPYLKEAVYSNGKLYAVPIDVSISGWAYNPTVFHEVGLDADAVPQTYAELIDLLKWWSREGYEMFPKYHVFLGIADSRKYLVDEIILDYVNSCTLQGIPIDFERAYFVELLHSIDELDTGELDRHNAQETPDIAYGVNTLFSLDSNYSNLSDVMGKHYLPMRLRFEASDSYFPVDIRVFAVNPNSGKVAATLEYIIAFMEGMDAEKKLSLFNDPSALPIENPEYQTEFQDWQKQLDALNATTDLKEADRVQLKEQLTLDLAAIRNDQWRVTAEQINQFRELMPFSRVRPQNLLERNSTNGTLEIQELVKQFVERTLSLEQFTVSINQMVKLISME